MTDVQAKAAPTTAKATVKPGRFPITPEVAEFLATLLPDSSPQNMQNFFDDTFDTGDGYDAAMSAFYSYRDVGTAGVMIGATSPPSHPDFPVISCDAGPFTIRYNSLYPAHLQAGVPFCWSFYIGWRGKESMPDWQEQGISCEIQDAFGRWGECTALMVVPSTRVRLTYDQEQTNGQTHAGRKTKRVTHELVFPPDPREEWITVHYM